MSMKLFGIILTALFILSMPDCLKLFAETYQWMDKNGSIHFSDNPPMNAPENILRKDETVIRDQGKLKRISEKIETHKIQKDRRDRSRYMNHIQSRIDDAFRKTIAYTIPNPKTIVRIFVDMNGKLSRTKIERSSGDRVFDLSVLRAIDLASEKFLPPPDNKVFEDVFLFKPKTDKDDSVHFSNSPMNTPKDKRPIVHRDEGGIEPSESSRRLLSASSESNSQPLKHTSRMASSACIKEFENAANICNSQQNLSPICLKQIYLRQEPKVSATCQQELQLCLQKNISAKCKEQLETAGRRIQEETKICEEATQNIIRNCGNGQVPKDKCYDEHRAELAAICNRK